MTIDLVELIRKIVDLTDPMMRYIYVDVSAIEIFRLAHESIAPFPPSLSFVDVSLVGY